VNRDAELRNAQPSQPTNVAQSRLAKVSRAIRRNSRVELDVDDGAFSNEVVLHLVDDCIVPALVDAFLRSRSNLPLDLEDAHNVDQP